MHFREAQPNDIPQIQIVRWAVKENRLSDPSLVTDEDCQHFLFHCGKGWVCEVDDRIVGFSIADLQNNNAWALFVDPAFTQQGIGKKLQRLMLDWYFQQTQSTIWLGTAPNTRAAQFYRMTGWKEIGLQKNGEIGFEMEAAKWEKKTSGKS
jgi:GNAT superfamily N-acetyltransferase